jgi:hypothetical protein
MGGEAAVMFCRAGYGNASGARGRRTMSAGVRCVWVSGGGGKREGCLVQKMSPLGAL